MQTRSSHSPTNSGDDINTRKNAIWTVREEAELIYALSKSKAEMTGTSFREAAYTYAVGEIQPFYERGMRKDVRSCKNKWNNVCISLYMLYWYPDVHNQLKRMYAAVLTLKSKSGFAWDNEKGMDVTPDTEDAWEQLVKVCEYV